ncbi:MAG: orotidine-5'-phosphate decarboxylase, partial [Salinibacterium sp.]|nr:orotidine-5'-phosphate decarboxylase [Salinibacterium sp.]
MLGPSFGDRLDAAFREHGQLCLGIDPHAELLAQWGLPDSAFGAKEFGLRVVEAAAGRVGIVKPQVAFFERHGAAGYLALEAVIVQARAAGLIVIADAKRGDVGPSVEAYGEAWLRPGSPLESDAVTISPFLGVSSSAAVIELAIRSSKGVFVLAATSNPEAFGLQSARIVGPTEATTTLAAAIVNEVESMNSAGDRLGSIGVVLGATLELKELGIRFSAQDRAPILAPGFGAQGAKLVDAARLFGVATPRVLATVSRSVLAAGPAGMVHALEAAGA